MRRGASECLLYWQRLKATRPAQLPRAPRSLHLTENIHTFAGQPSCPKLPGEHCDSPLPSGPLCTGLGIDGPCEHSLHDVLRSRNLASSLVVLRRLIRVVYATIDDAWRIRGSGFDPSVAPLGFLRALSRG